MKIYQFLKKLSWLKNSIITVFILVIFYYLGKNLYLNWSSIPWTQIKFRYPYLILSFVFLYLGFLGAIWSWKLILKELGAQISFSRASRIISLALLAKYVPGGVWLSLSRIYLAQKEKISKSIATASLILQTQILLLSALLFYFFSIPQVLQKNFKVFYFQPLFLILLALVLFYPQLSHYSVNFLLKFFKREKINLKLKYRKFIYIIAIYLVIWFLNGIAFYFLVKSVCTVSENLFIPIAGCFVTAWIAGFVVFFAPGGLGVREGILTLLLKFFMPYPLAIAISLLSRVWITIYELGAVLITIKLK